MSRIVRFVDEEIPDNDTFQNTEKRSPSRGQETRSRVTQKGTLKASVPRGKETCSKKGSIKPSSTRGKEALGKSTLKSNVKLAFARGKIRAAVQLTELSWWARFKSTECVRHEGVWGTLAQGGNTCFLAAALQTLFHTSSFENWLQLRSCTCCHRQCPSCVLGDTACRARFGVSVGLSEWEHCLSAMGWEIGKEADIGEFLQMLFNYWDTYQEHAARMDGSQLKACFEFTEIKRIEKYPSCSCNLPRMTYNVYNRTAFLDLPLAESGPDLELSDLLKEYCSRADIVSSELADRCWCSAPLSVFHTSSFLDMVHRPVLLFGLKRARLHGTKNRRRIEIPDQLVLAQRRFHLRSVAHHLEGYQSGHYITWVRQPDGYLIYDERLFSVLVAWFTGDDAHASIPCGLHTPGD